jgi:hypothetical protein
MPYVSCVYAPPDPISDSNLKEGEQRIICVDENDVEWHLTTASEVGDWLRFVEDGGQVREAPQVDPAKQKKGKTDG